MTGGQDVDRRAWHLAAAVDEPDDGVVAALDGAARRATARGGFEAASAAFERAAELTSDAKARSTRLLAAAINAWLAAQLPRAMRVATTARAGVTDPVVRADLDRLRGRIEFVAGSVPVGVGIWSQAARDVVATDPQRAREIGMIATAGSTFLAEQDRAQGDASMKHSPHQQYGGRCPVTVRGRQGPATHHHDDADARMSMAKKTDRVRLPEIALLSVNLATGAIRRLVDTY